MQTELFIGLMSGTSLDGVDACLIESSSRPSIISSLYEPFSGELKSRLSRLIAAKQVSLHELAELEVDLSRVYAEAVHNLLAQSELTPQEITAIGCHGQTIYHLPEGDTKYSMQIGSGAHLAELTAIPVVTDFRNNDMALGGQGAPLVCAFHKALSPESDDQMFLNLGGIANLTWIPESGPVLGFDTGPANALLDAWYQKHNTQYDYDQYGEWADSGEVVSDLLTAMLEDDYFASPAPKSTGKEYFNLKWLTNILNAVDTNIAPQDVQATLVELTATSIVNEIAALKPRHLYVFGGGIHNKVLMSSLQSKISLPLRSTLELGIDPDVMEAAAFAWLAKRCLMKLPGTLSSVTGSKRDAQSGAVYYPSL